MEGEAEWTQLRERICIYGESIDLAAVDSFEDFLHRAIWNCIVFRLHSFDASMPKKSHDVVVKGSPEGEHPARLREYQTACSIPQPRVS